jgi:DNA-binding MarR family transcriptional regulator
VSTDNSKIERQLTVLLRKSVRIHLTTQSGDVSLERSAYGIMCQLADDGPQRLGALAAAFGLDPSTITRQVRDLENAGFAFRETDPSDRRAYVLDLTATGRDVLKRSREHRRSRLGDALSSWSSRDLNDFGRLLQEFNTSMDRLSAFGVLLVTHGFMFV